MKSRSRWLSGLVALVLAGLAQTGSASAHGPVDPTASRWQARIVHAPAGVQVEPVDGDLRLWLRADPGLTVEVLDYRGAPYLRFDRAGVEENHNSAMFYVNQVPPVVPPISLGPNTRPDWRPVSSGHARLWQDGRPQALSRTVLAPGSGDAGRWSVPLLIDGRRATITGELYHRPDVSPVWFWPILVVLGCVLAGLRLRRAELDRRLGRGLALAALAAFTLGSLGHQLHGRPSVTAGQLVVLGIELAFAAWAAAVVVRRRPFWVVLMIVAGVTLWQGVVLAPALVDGYVLLALPAVLGRIAAAGCLAAGAGLVPVVLVAAERSGLGRSRPREDPRSGRAPQPVA